KFISALARAGKEDRIRVWVKEPKLEAKLKPTVISGALPHGTNPPAIGIYLNDGTLAKMDYYLDASDDPEAVSCSDAGAQHYEVNLVFFSKAPKDAATSLTPYILGPTNPHPGRMDLSVVALSPRGGERPSFSILGTKYRGTPLTVDGRPAAKLSIPLYPASFVPITVTMTSAPGQRGPTAFAMTPTVRSGVNRETIPSACQ
ncbi:MAG: hypothetical protein JWP74_140, partial [Marmoricola sp.]|nr:hypothetical protein [Marmoricola sp.]